MSLVFGIIATHCSNKVHVLSFALQTRIISKSFMLFSNKNDASIKPYRMHGKN